jgi:hypothetical protein
MRDPTSRGKRIIRAEGAASNSESVQKQRRGSRFLAGGHVNLFVRAEFC